MWRAALAGMALVVSGAALAAPAPRIASMNVCTDQLVLSLADPGQILGLSRYARDDWQSFAAGDARKFPVLSGGFEIETELTIHALELELPAAEIRTPYYARPQGSASKLNTWRDGLRILLAILKIYRAERPLALFSAVGIGLAAISIGLAIPIFITYLEQGTVPRFPTAILSTGLMLAALLAFACGLVLDTVTGSDAERLYVRKGWLRVGEIPSFALWPNGGLCPTTYYYRVLPT